MTTAEIIAALDHEIEALEKARALLAGSTSETKPVVVVKPRMKKKRNISPEGRARIAEAVKRRWARQKKKAEK